MNIEEVTLRCVQKVANIFKGGRDEESLRAHSSLNSLHKHY